MSIVQFVQLVAAIAAGYVFGYSILNVGTRIGYRIEHWWYHYRTGKPHLTDEERNKALAQFVLTYDPSAEDPEVESQSYEFCRKCKQVKKNFVGEGRRKLCMDCAFGDDHVDEL